MLYIMELKVIGTKSGKKQSYIIIQISEKTFYVDYDIHKNK